MRAKVIHDGRIELRSDAQHRGAWGRRPGRPDRLRTIGSFDGTSASAPIVAGVAALLQSIRPEQAFLKPDVIRQLLIDTADDISDKWNPGRMVRVNALKAVHAVLSGGGPLSFYVSDNELPTANAIGGIVSVGVDPLTGAAGDGRGPGHHHQSGGDRRPYDSPTPSSDIVDRVAGG